MLAIYCIVSSLRKSDVFNSPCQIQSVPSYYMLIDPCTCMHICGGVLRYVYLITGCSTWTWWYNQKVDDDDGVSWFTGLRCTLSLNEINKQDSAGLYVWKEVNAWIDWNDRWELITFSFRILALNLIGKFISYTDQ